MRFPIPDGWSKSKLTELAKVQTGIAKGKKDLVDSISLPYLRVANVQDGHLNLAEVKKIEVSRTQVERFSLRDGDVLFTEGGDFDKLGRGTVWRNEIPNCLHQNHVFAVRVSSNSMLPYFLATYASSFWGRTYFRSCSKQTTNLASINSTQLKAMPLPVPPLPEQRKIAEILSTWDRAIELTEKMIAAKQKRKQALMQKLLTGKVRFKEFAEAWMVQSFSKIVTNLTSGARNWSQYYAADGDLFLRMTNLSRDGITLKLHSLKYVQVPNGSAESDRTVVESGDILFSVTAELGKLAWIPEGLGKAFINQHTALIRVDSKKVDSKFLAYLLSSHRQQFRIKRLTDAGAKAGMSLKTLRSFRVPMPPLREQTQIAEIFSGCDWELDVLESKKIRLQQQKKGLMQQLLTGKTRVKIDADGTEA